MTDLQMDTTKDAALRLCAEVVEERDALKAVLREFCDAADVEGEYAGITVSIAYLDTARALLARLDGRTG